MNIRIYTVHHQTVKNVRYTTSLSTFEILPQPSGEAAHGNDKTYPQLSSRSDNHKHPN
jgi:hypothetical protein